MLKLIDEQSGVLLLESVETSREAAVVSPAELNLVEFGKWNERAQINPSIVQVK